MLHATLIGPGLTLGVGGGGVFTQPGILGCESRSEERSGGREGTGRWSAGGCGGWECHLSLWMRCWMSRVRTCLHEAERIGCERRPRSSMPALLWLRNPHWKPVSKCCSSVKLPNQLLKTFSRIFKH